MWTDQPSVVRLGKVGNVRWRRWRARRGRGQHGARGSDPQPLGPVSGVAPSVIQDRKCREWSGIRIPDAAKIPVEHRHAADVLVVAVDVPIFVNRLEREGLDSVVSPREIATLVGRIPNRPVGGQALGRLGVKEDVRLVGRLVAGGKAIFERDDRFGVWRPLGVRSMRGEALAIAIVVDRLVIVVPPPAQLLIGENFLLRKVRVTSLR